MTTLETFSLLANIAQILSLPITVISATNIRWNWLNGLGKYKVPIIFGLIFLASTLAKRFVPSDSFVNEPPRITVEGKKFYNTEVIVDDRVYTNCYMQNVTRRFMGTRPFLLTGNEMSVFILKFDKPEMQIVAAVLSQSGFMNTNIHVISN